MVARRLQSKALECQKIVDCSRDPYAEEHMDDPVNARLARMRILLLKWRRLLQPFEQWRRCDWSEEASQSSLPSQQLTPASDGIVIPTVVPLRVGKQNACSHRPHAAAIACVSKAFFEGSSKEHAYKVNEDTYIVV